MKNFLEKKFRRKGQQAQKDKTEKVTGLDRRRREEIAKWNQMTALRLQTGGRHQTSPASLRGWGGGVREKKKESERETRRDETDNYLITITLFEECTFDKENPNFNMEFTLHTLSPKFKLARELWIPVLSADLSDPSPAPWRSEVGSPQQSVGTSFQ